MGEIFVSLIYTTAIFVYSKRRPAQINNFVGYRTKRAKSSEVAWTYAQKKLIQIGYISGIIMFLMNLILYLIHFEHIIFLPIRVLLMLSPFLLTEFLLKIKFDENGNLK